MTLSVSLSARSISTAAVGGSCRRSGLDCERETGARRDVAEARLEAERTEAKLQARETRVPSR